MTTDKDSTTFKNSSLWTSLTASEGLKISRKFYESRCASLRRGRRISAVARHPGYDVAALVEKSGKSASHIYARLSLLQLIPEVTDAFTQERITASHANLIARLPQESQAEAFEQCWRKDWQDSEPHLLPAKHVSAWIQNNLYLSLADAPFDREDPSLNPAAGACVTCPRRSGYPQRSCSTTFNS